MKKDDEVAKLVKPEEVLPTTSEVLTCVRTFNIVGSMSVDAPDGILMSGNVATAHSFEVFTKIYKGRFWIMSHLWTGQKLMWCICLPITILWEMTQRWFSLTSPFRALCSRCQRTP
jgi:hypothetical protein